MVSNGYTANEAMALEAALAGDIAVLRLLREQYVQSHVTERELSGSGFYLDISVPSELTIPGNPNFVIDDVHAELKGMPWGMDYLLFIENGLIVGFEGSAYGEELPSDYVITSLSYRASPRTDLIKMETNVATNISNRDFP